MEPLDVLQLVQEITNDIVTDEF